MGRIVASGGACPDDEEVIEIYKKIVALCPKENAKVLYVPTAGHDFYDDLGEFQKTFTSLGCSECSVLLLTDENLTYEEIENTILSSDIIFVGGGNLKFLMDVWNKTGATDIMKKAFEKGIVLSGSSSGSMCWFEKGYDDCGENNEFMIIDCLGLLPGCNCPHYDSEYWQTFDKVIPKLDIDGIAIDNDAALVFVDGEYSVLSQNENRSAYLLSERFNFERKNLKSENLL